MRQPLPVHLRHAEPIPLAVVRRRARQSELPSVVPQSCGLVWEFARARHLRAGRNVAVYLDGAINLEVGVEVPEPFAEQDDIVRSTTPSGLAASVVHFGPYHELSKAYEAIRAWCAENGYRVSGASWEIYGHWQPEWNTDPSRIRTDVFCQVASAGTPPT